jgi:hypothetical protein
MTKREKGREGFALDYWQANYSEPEEMDGIVNAGEHALYLKHFFGVEYVDINSVIDFGFGLGHIFEAVLKEFIPYRAQGIEPSEHAFKEVKKRAIRPVESTNLKIECTDLVSWCEKNKDKGRAFDLGICTSVFQYLEDKEIEKVLPVMAAKTKFLYFSVPTDKELDRQKSDLEFCDQYAIRRSRSRYLKWLAPHFTIVGARLLESRHFHDEETTPFTDLLFRF